MTNDWINLVVDFSVKDQTLVVVGKDSSDKYFVDKVAWNGDFDYSEAIRAIISFHCKKYSFNRVFYDFYQLVHSKEILEDICTPIAVTFPKVQVSCENPLDKGLIACMLVLNELGEVQTLHEKSNLLETELDVLEEIIRRLERKIKQVENAYSNEEVVKRIKRANKIVQANVELEIEQVKALQEEILQIIEKMDGK